MEKIFYTIKEVARAGILSEYHLRLRVQQGKAPYITSGKKVLINFPLLIERLNEESMQAIKRNDDEEKRGKSVETKRNNRIYF